MDKKLEDSIKNLPRLEKLFKCLKKDVEKLLENTTDQNLFVKNISEFTLNGTLLEIVFQKEDNTFITLSQDIFSLQETEIKNNVSNFSELSSIQNPELYDFAYVRNSQGTKWLPGNLGGTYYGKGLYMWDGTSWTEDDTEIFNELETLISNLNLEIQQRQNSESNLQNQIDLLESNKVTKNFLGWVQISDTQYNQTNPLSISANQRTKLTNNSQNILNIVGLFGGTTLWNSTSNKFENDNSGDKFLKRVQFTADPTLNNRNLTLELDIGGSQGVIWERTIRLARGAGVDTKITENLDFYTLSTFIANGGELYLTCDGDLNIYDIVFLIQRTFRND